MATCPAGHESETTDYCDVCGALIAAGPTGAMSAPSLATPTVPAAEAGSAECPSCGARSSGRFCEDCGHDLTMPTMNVAAVLAPASQASAPPTGRPAASAPPAEQERQGTWLAIVRADRAYFEQIRAKDGPDAESIEFPHACPERRITLTGPTARIGRRSGSRHVTPEIDLAGPPLDPGVSRLHALLVARPGEGWSLVDSGSANGTTVNDDEEPIEEGVPVPLVDGDRVHVGAWTTIELRRLA